MDREKLLESFRYDLWSSLRWLTHLEEIGLPEPDKSVLSHHAAANIAWLSRIEGTPLTSPPQVELSAETFKDLFGRWEKLFSIVEGNPTYRFKRFTGEESSATFEEIARQVANHGTYHRGELRGLARARGDEAFPETDFIMFCRLAEAGKL